MPSVADASPASPSRTASVDWKGIAAHGIGRGDFAALVFSGATEAIGEAAGYCTWSTARKFALPDPRLRSDEDLARDPASPLPLWSNDRVRPTPSVCFVFANGGHPAIDAFQARGGVEFEHYVVLSRVTEARLIEWRMGRFLDAAGRRPIALLGFGDQGSKASAVLMGRGIEAGHIHVVDDRPERQVAAANAGFAVVSLDDAVIEEAAIFATPLSGVGRFGGTLRRAIADGRPVLDNACSWDGREEFTPRGRIHLTSCVDRCVSCDGSGIRIADNGLALPLSIIADADASIGGVSCRLLRTMRPVERCREDGPFDLEHLSENGGPGLRVARFHRWYVGLAGQSNHIDAAFGIFAARAFLLEMFPEAAAEVLPSRHRGGLGATAFEALVPRSCTGRSLGSPYMTPAEQTAIGVLARHYARCGAAGHSIIEIGSALGGSGLLMAAATRGATGADGPPIVSIDPDVATRPSMRAAFEVEEYASRLMPIVKTSDEAIAEVGRAHRAAGLVFIDGLHTADAVGRDIDNYAPLIRPGGCLVLHDCDARHAGVFRTAARLAASDSRFTLRCMIDSLAVFERRM